MADMVVVSKILEFAQKNTAAMDVALQKIAVDITAMSKMQVPVGPTKAQNKSSTSSGQLKSSGLFKRIGLLNWVVGYNKVYAAYQEFGSWPDGSHVIKRHTKPGSKTHYLRDPGNLIVSRAMTYIKREAAAIKVDV